MDSAISKLTEAETVALVACELNLGRSVGDIVDTLILKNLTRAEARHAVSMIRHGFDAEMSASFGVQTKSIWANDPFFAAAREYAQMQIGAPDAPRQFQRKWAALDLAIFLLLILATVLGSFLVGNYMPDRVIFGIGLIAAIIALVTSPLIFYYIYALGLDCWHFSVRSLARGRPSGPSTSSTPTAASARSSRSTT
jgi:hypothetical protein